jgi:putative ABC transport system permease protein
MGIPLLAGRSFQTGDQPDAPHVVVINETLARRIYPDEQALGRHILWGGRNGTELLEIVGIVGDVKQQGLAEDAMPAVYLEYAQFNVAASMYLTLRASGDPLDLVPNVRNALRALDPDLPLYEVTTMDRLLSDSVESERFSMLLLALFAAVALLLGSVGIYGVMSYTVSQRTREVGVRMALGAAHGNVVALVVRQGMLLTLAGICLGAVGTLALSRVLSGMLFQVSATDPLTFISVTILLAMVALLACYMPARRAAGIDPLEALRYE